MELVDLAQNYFGDTRAGSLAGPIGAFLVAALAVTTVLLIRNMNARLRRLPASFSPQPGEDAASPDEGTQHDPDATAPDPRTPGNSPEAPA